MWVCVGVRTRVGGGVEYIDWDLTVSTFIALSIQLRGFKWLLRQLATHFIPETIYILWRCLDKNWQLIMRDFVTGFTASRWVASVTLDVQLITPTRGLTELKYRTGTRSEKCENVMRNHRHFRGIIFQQAIFQQDCRHSFFSLPIS